MSDGPRTSASGSPAPPKPSTPSPPKDAPAPAFEFAEAQREVFASLAASVSFVGVCVILIGGLSGIFALAVAYAGLVANGIAVSAGAAVWGIVAVLTGWWMMSAGRSLSALVRTRGQDIDRLMEAVVQLRRVFGVARVAIIVYAMVLMAAGAAVAWCSFGGGKCGGLFG